MEALTHIPCNPHYNVLLLDTQVNVRVSLTSSLTYLHHLFDEILLPMLRSLPLHHSHNPSGQMPWCGRACSKAGFHVQPLWS